MVLHMAEGVVLTGASVVVTTAPPGNIRASSVSIMVTAKALAEIDLLIAQCCVDIVLPDSGQRSYDMVTNPIRLDTLGRDLAVLIRGADVVGRVDLVVALRLDFENRLNQRKVVFQHDYGDVCLSTDSPVVTRRLPLSRIRFDH
jgi:hypothetical protein